MLISLPYISIAVFYYILNGYSKINRIAEKESEWHTTFILIFFFCFRGYIFTDVHSYYPFFMHSVPSVSDVLKMPLAKWSWWEPGFSWYMVIIKIFTKNYLAFQFIDSLIDIVLLRSCLKYFSAYKPINIMVFFAMDGMIIFIDTLRNAKAILIFIYSIRFVVNKKIFKYYLCCILAFLMHQESIVFFICYPLLKYIRLSKSSFIFLCVFSVAFSVLSSSILVSIVESIINKVGGRYGDMFEAYILNESVKGRGLSIGMIEKIISAAFIYIFYDSFDHKPRNEVIIKCFLLYFMFYFCFSSFSIVSTRMSVLFSFSYWILWPQFITVQKTKNYKVIVSFLLLTYAVIKMSLYNQPVQTYENILFGISDIGTRSCLRMSR